MLIKVLFILLNPIKLLFNNILRQVMIPDCHGDDVLFNMQSDYFRTVELNMQNRNIFSIYAFLHKGATTISPKSEFYRTSYTTSAPPYVPRLAYILHHTFTKSIFNNILFVLRLDVGERLRFVLMNPTVNHRDKSIHQLTNEVGQAIFRGKYIFLP